MNYVILDLEWNGSYSSKLHKFINEIIEFGAVKVDENFNITETFSKLINPQIGKKICGRVKALTGLSTEELREKGSTFMSVAREFEKFSEGCVLVTWGTTDIHALIENYSYYTGDIKMPFPSLYCDAQHYCEKSLDKRRTSANQLGLGACAEMIGIKYSEEEQHRAFADAELTLECIKKLHPGYALDDFIVKVDSKFYDRIIFKNYFLTDINDREIDRSCLRFKCEKCGKKLTPKKKWAVKNKSFLNEFKCPSCGYEFIARVSFKKKYDGVDVKRRTVDKKYIEAKKAEARAQQAKNQAQQSKQC